MAPTTESRSIYSELDSNRFCIRLLKLLPPSDGAVDAIHCMLYSHYLDISQWTEYEALSYTWGNSAADHSITINGQPFRVRDNLLSALRHLRLEHEPRLLWIDAICINQNSDDEKSIQVSQMHRIYRLARRVVIWLGDSTETSGHALDLIRQAASIHNKALVPPKDSIFHSEVVQEQRTISETALTEFFGRPWWQRVWVFQEAVYAQTIIFMCGQDILDISWRDLVSAYQEIVGKVSSQCKPTVSRAWMILNVDFVSSIIKLEGPEGRTFLELQRTLLHLLNQFRKLLATDPRDYLFAILNMDSPDGLSSGRRLIPVDYKMDTASVLTHAARAITKLAFVRPNLEILVFVEIRTDEADFPCHSAVDPQVWSRRVEVPGLPSWVPNWAQPAISNDLGFGYKASDGLNMPWSIGQYTESPKDCFLKMQALRIGVVSKIGSDITCTNGTAKDFFHDLHDIAARSDSLHIPPNQSYNEVLIRTLTVNDLYGSVPATAYSTDNFDELPKPLQSKVGYMMIGRRVVVLQDGFVGLGPRAARLGDVVYIVPDCPLPMVMREYKCPTEQGQGTNEEKDGRESITGTDIYQLVGPCYIHGLMDGEVCGLMGDFVPDRWQWQNIEVR